MTAQHRYAVGQTVYYFASPTNPYRSSGAYRIVRLLPMSGPYLQYDVRSTLEDFDRVASEWQLNTYSQYRGFHAER
jgi:hypothetical protein